MTADADMLPVVETGTLQASVINAEAKGLDQLKR